MERRSKPKPKNELASQLKRHSREVSDKKIMEGNTEVMISTGSTLLDLAISGKRKRGGGIPGGILLEAFGPEGSGKTVLLCEIAGAIQRQGGDILFNDPEARLNRQFASMFDLDTDSIQIEEPDTVTQVFRTIYKWEPVRTATVHGIVTDSLAALSTNMEMDNEDGDKMGMRRAKEFSEGLRKTARLLKQKNYIMACSNQIRDNADATGYGEKFSVPGGRAISFYASVRLRLFKPEKVTVKKTVRGKEVKKVVATKVKVQVYKNSCDEPYREAYIYIDFGYGIDDIRANLQYLKDFSSSRTYHLDGESLGVSLEKAVREIEEKGLEEQVREAVIDVWEEVQDAFKVKRKRKERM